jgi:hypothetical protein
MDFECRVGGNSQQTQLALFCVILVYSGKLFGFGKGKGLASNELL